MCTSHAFDMYMVCTCIFKAFAVAGFQDSFKFFAFNQFITHKGFFSAFSGVF